MSAGRASQRCTVALGDKHMQNKGQNQHTGRIVHVRGAKREGPLRWIVVRRPIPKLLLPALEAHGKLFLRDQVPAIVAHLLQGCPDAPQLVAAARIAGIDGAVLDHILSVVHDGGVSGSLNNLSTSLKPPRCCYGVPQRCYTPPMAALAELHLTQWPAQGMTAG